MSEEYERKTDTEIVKRFVSDAEGNELILSIMKCWSELEPPQRAALTGFVDNLFDDYQRRKAEAMIAQTEAQMYADETDFDTAQKQA